MTSVRRLPESSPCHRRQRQNQQCQRRKRSTTYLNAFVSLATSVMAAASSSSQASPRQTSTRHHLLSISSPRHFDLEQKPHLHLRQRRAKAENEETNDDAFTIVSITPFEIRLSNVPTASPVAVTKSSNAASSSPASDAAMNSVMNHITSMGTRTFQASSRYGERFDHLDVGGTWSSDFTQRRPSNSGRMLENANAASNKGTTTLSLGQDGTVTFNGRYWEDDPASEELTNFMVTELNSDANREELLTKLRPVVCTPEEMIGNDCDLELELMAVSDVDAEEEKVVLPEKPVVAAKPETVPSDVPAVDTTAADPAGTVTGFEIEAASPQATDDDSNSNLKVIIPVAVGASLVALGLAAMLYLRRRNKKEEQPSSKLNEPAESDEIAQEVLPPAQWANSAYDSITAPNEANKSAPLAKADANA